MKTEFNINKFLHKNSLLKNEFFQPNLRGFPMRKNQNFFKLAIIIAIILSGVGSLYAQTFDNTGGTYEANTNAVLRINNASTPAPIIGIGATALTRIQGIVDWAEPSAIQAVQVLYYTNLFASGGIKTLADGIYVGGSGTDLTPYSGYANLDNTGATAYGYYATSGARTYSGTFYYDGDADQTLFSEAGTSGSTNQYDILNLLSYDGASLKTTGGDIFLKQNLELEATATMANAFNFTVEEGISYAKGNITNTDGSFSTLSTGTFDLGAGTTPTIFEVTGGFLSLQSTGPFTVLVDGKLSLNGTDALKRFEMLNTSYLLDLGVFENLESNHANMTFSDLSTVEYGGATDGQNVVATVNTGATNPYAKLIFSGAGTKTLEGLIAGTAADIYSRGTVDISGGNVQISTAAQVNVTNRSFYTDATGGNKVTFPAADIPYVQGNMVLYGTINTTDTYTLNNYETQVKFGTSPGANTFGLNVYSGIAPHMYATYDATQDVKRNIYMNYGGNTGILTLLKVGFDPDTDIDGTFLSSNETLLRFGEGFNAVQPLQNIAGGTGPATNSGAFASTTHWVNLIGNGSLGILLNDVASGGNTFEVSDGSNIVLTAKPYQFIAVNNGRWTNPNTWIDGIVPSSIDNTIIRAVVYAGIAGPAYGTGASGNVTPEATEYLNGNGWNGQNLVNQIAHSITIDNVDNYALIIGNEDNGAGYVLKTAGEGLTQGTTAIVSGLYNNSLFGYTGDWDDKDNTAPPTNHISGLWVTNIMGGVGFEPVFNPSKIENKGTIVNHGIIEIGNKP